MIYFTFFSFFILLELFWLASNSSPFAAAAEALATASEPAESFWLSKLSDIKLWQGVARKVQVASEFLLPLSSVELMRSIFIDAGWWECLHLSLIKLYVIVSILSTWAFWDAVPTCLKGVKPRGHIQSRDNAWWQHVTTVIKLREKTWHLGPRWPRWA